MHGAVLLWGFTGVLGQLISVDAPVLVWYRTIFTAIIIAVILFYRGEWSKISKRDMSTLLLVGALIGLHWVCFFGAIKLANISIALVCLSTASVFTALLDPLVNRSKPKIAEILLGLLAVAGVFVIYLLRKPIEGRDVRIGIGLGVVAAMLSALFTVLNKRVAHKYPARTMVFYEMTSAWLTVTVITGVVLGLGLERFIVSPRNATGELQLLPYGLDWLWLAILSLCCTVWAQSMALNALKQLSSFTVTLTVNLEPVYGIILAFIFFKENKVLPTGFYVGVALIIGSVALQMARLMRPAMSPGYVKEKGGLD